MTVCRHHELGTMSVRGSPIWVSCFGGRERAGAERRFPRGVRRLLTSLRTFISCVIPTPAASPSWSRRKHFRCDG